MAKGPVSKVVDSTTPPGPIQRLNAEELQAHKTLTLETPRRRYSISARALFVGMDFWYGRKKTIEKFRILELIARVPYQAWENVAYVALTHKTKKPGFARRVFDTVRSTRREQDNEQWHLLIMEELVADSNEKYGWVKHRVIPQMIAFVYYQWSWFLYVLKPAWSYRLNADFEDHAQHEYVDFVAEHPELDEVGYDGMFSAEYGQFGTQTELFLQISNDELMHKLESIAQMKNPRFN